MRRQMDTRLKMRRISHSRRLVNSWNKTIPCVLHLDSPPSTLTDRPTDLTDNTCLYRLQESSMWCFRKGIKMFIRRLFPSISLLAQSTEMGVDENNERRKERKGRREKHGGIRLMIHTSFFGYRNDKSCTQKQKKIIYRRKGRLSKKEKHR